MFLFMLNTASQLFWVRSYLIYMLLWKLSSHILSLFSVNDTKGKKKVLGSNQKLKFNPTELILYCKDLRIIRFCFHEAGPESAKKVSGTEMYFFYRMIIVI